MSRRKSRILAFQALYSYDVGGIELNDLLKLEWTESDFAESDAEIKASVSNAALAQAAGQLDTVESVDSVSSESAAEASEEADTETQDYARILIAGTINHLEEVDAQIKSHLSPKWDFSRLNKVTLAIVRISVYAILFQPDLASQIVIDEAVSIAKQYGADDAYKFINAILDTISKEHKQA